MALHEKIYSISETASRKIRGPIPFSKCIALICCAVACLTLIGLDVMVAHREEFQALSAKEKRQWLLDYFWSHSRLILKLFGKIFPLTIVQIANARAG